MSGIERNGSGSWTRGGRCVVGRRSRCVRSDGRSSRSFRWSSCGEVRGRGGCRRLKTSRVIDRMRGRRRESGNMRLRMRCRRWSGRRSDLRRIQGRGWSCRSRSERTVRHLQHSRFPLCFVPDEELIRMNNEIPWPFFLIHSSRSRDQHQSPLEPPRDLLRELLKLSNQMQQDRSFILLPQV